MVGARTNLIPIRFLADRRWDELDTSPHLLPGPGLSWERPTAIWYRSCDLWDVLSPGWSQLWEAGVYSAAVPAPRLMSFRDALSPPLVMEQRKAGKCLSVVTVLSQCEPLRSPAGLCQPPGLLFHLWLQCLLGQGGHPNPGMVHWLPLQRNDYSWSLPSTWTEPRGRPLAYGCDVQQAWLRQRGQTSFNHR